MSKQTKRLTDVLAVQSYSGKTELMQGYITKFVSKHAPGATLVNDDGNIYITKGAGKTFPCVVAHTDTVHNIAENLTVIERDGILFGMNMEKVEQAGIGGDDKVGIYIALECLIKFDNIKVAFFRDEEIGCHGSLVADMGYFDDTEFVIQCDRRGYDDVVSEIYHEPMFTEEFRQAIKPLMDEFGKKEASGALTDVYQLALNGLDVCATNLSCGYYAPHSESEFVVIRDVMDTLEFVASIIDTCGGKRWEIDRLAEGPGPNKFKKWDAYSDETDYDEYDWFNRWDLGKYKELGQSTGCLCTTCGIEVHTDDELRFETCSDCFQEIMEQDITDARYC